MHKIRGALAGAAGIAALALAACGGGSHGGSGTAAIGGLTVSHCVLHAQAMQGVNAGLPYPQNYEDSSGTCKVIAASRS